MPESSSLETIFSEFYQNNQYTDLEIIFDDSSKQKNMYVHKLILIAKCPYFKRMLGFSGGFPGKSVKIFVEDANIARDIVQSFYGITNDRTDIPYVLSTIKIRDFFCLDNDYKKLLKLKIPAEYYGMLIEVVNLLGLNNKLAKLLVQNKPLDYDLKDPKLFEMMTKNDIRNDILFRTNDYVYIYNIFEEKQIELRRTYKDEYIIDVKYSHNAKYVLIVTNLIIVEPNSPEKKTLVYLWDIQKKILLKEFELDILINSFTFTPDDQYIIMSRDGFITIYNLDGIFLRNIYVSSYINHLCVSPNGFYLIYGFSPSTMGIYPRIKIWQLDYLLDTTKYLSDPVEIILKDTSKIINIVYSPDNKYFCISAYRNIFVYCAQSLQLKLDLWPQHVNDDYIQNIAYSSDGSRLLVTTANSIIMHDMSKAYEGDSSSCILQKIGNTVGATMAFYTDDLRHIITNSKSFIAFWDAATGELLRKEYVSYQDIKSLSISPKIH